MTTITVTQEHIDGGKRRSSLYCPLAAAISEAYPRFLVSVGSVTVLFSYCTTGTRVTLSQPLTGTMFKFRCDFDADYEVQPTSFDVDWVLPNRDEVI